MNFKNTLKTTISKLYHNYFAPLFGAKLKVFKRHQSYESYVLKQKHKTLDSKRIKKWLGEEWEVKLDGFRKLFSRNEIFVKSASKCICLGARTGQEVAALRELGKDAIGIDLVEFPPLTIIGDVHNLDYKEGTFDLVFTNIFDHSMYPSKFVKEMERVCLSGGHVIINLQLNTPGDDYSENIIYDPNEVVKMFEKSELIESRKISNSFDEMNWELVLKKVNSK